MFLEKVEIQGFKSFAGTISLVFNRELTAIVGPNGSGKSNIADAIRWALGEQSLKLLRGKKSEDVIFAGSDAKGRLGFARVALFLDNRDRQAGIDYDSIIIERTIERSGETAYLINGTRVRLHDVQLLLAKAHVGQKSYSVIGQGMIDSLLTFSAQERRDFFDEATGVKQYQLKKHQALQKLEHTEENLTQAELVLQELEPRLRTLTRQVRRLEKKEILESQLTELQTDYYSYFTTDLENQLSTITAKKQSAEATINDLSLKLSNTQRELDEYERGQGRHESYDALQKKLFNLQQEYNALTKKKILIEGQKDIEIIHAGGGEAVRLRQRLEDLRIRERSLDDDVSRETRAQASALEKISMLETQTRDAKIKLTAIESQLASQSKTFNWKLIEGEASSINAEYETIAKKLHATTTIEELTGLKEHLMLFSEKLKKFLSSLRQTSQTNHEVLWREFNELTKNHEALTKQIHDEKIALELATQKIAHIKELVGETQKEIRETERALGSSKADKNETLAHDIAQLTEELGAKEKQMKGARDEIDTFNELEEEKKQKLLTLQKQFRTIQYDLAIQNNELTGLKVDLAKLETRKEDLEREIASEAPNIVLKKVTQLNATEAKGHIENAKRQLTIIGGIDTETVNEYKEVHEKHTYLSQQTTDLRHAQKSLTTLIEELDEHISKQFESAFKNINMMFSKYFKKLFNGGHAKLILQMNAQLESAENGEEKELADAEESEPQEKKKTKDSLDYTIEIQATPPGKKITSIATLSGGEKALTSISLVCAIIANNPPPFVVLDEVDAALDEANSIRFAEIISELTGKSQFITITHNRATMHQAKILYGVTMGDDGASRMLSVNFEQADQLSS